MKSEKEKKNTQAAETDEEINEQTQSEETAAESTEVKEEVKENPSNKELEEIKDKYVRVCAEYENYRKRSEKERVDSYVDGMTNAVKALLPVMDNLDRAIAFEPENEGVKMIVKQITDSFTKLGVAEIESDGKPFDPEFHNAIMHEEDPEKGENIVSQTFQKGYTLNGKIIRHAMVKVVN